MTLADGTYRLARPLDFAAADSGRPRRTRWCGRRPPAPTRCSPAPPACAAGRRSAPTASWSARVPRGQRHAVSSTSTARKRPSRRPPRPPCTSPAAGPARPPGTTCRDDPAAQAWFAAAHARPAAAGRVRLSRRATGRGPTPSAGSRSCPAARWSWISPAGPNVTDSRPVHPGQRRPAVDGHLTDADSTIENAASLLHQGSGSSTAPRDTLYYAPAAPAACPGLDVELPRLETLLQGAGSLAAPAARPHLQRATFSYATWNAPSSAGRVRRRAEQPAHDRRRTTRACARSPRPPAVARGARSPSRWPTSSFTASDHVTLDRQPVHRPRRGRAELHLRLLAQPRPGQRVRPDLASTAILLGCTLTRPGQPGPAHFPDYTTTNPDTRDDQGRLHPRPGRRRRGPDRAERDPRPHHGRRQRDPPHRHRLPLGVRHHAAVHPAHPDHAQRAVRPALHRHHRGVIQGHVDDADHPQNSHQHQRRQHDQRQPDPRLTCRSSATAARSTWKATRPQYVYQADGTTSTRRHTRPTACRSPATSSTTTARATTPSTTTPARSGSTSAATSTSTRLTPNRRRRAAARPPATSGHRQLLLRPRRQLHLQLAGRLQHQRQHHHPRIARPAATSRTPCSPRPDHRARTRRSRPRPRSKTRLRLGAHARHAPGPRPTRCSSAGPASRRSTPVYFGAEPRPRRAVLSPGFLSRPVPTGADGTDVTVGAYVPAPAITTPAAGTTGLGGRTRWRGTGVAGDTVTVTDTARRQPGCTVTAAPTAPGPATLTGSRPASTP